MFKFFRTFRINRLKKRKAVLSYRMQLLSKLIAVGNTLNKDTTNAKREYKNDFYEYRKIKNRLSSI